MGNRERIAELALKAQQGKQDAFNELYRLTRDRAYFVALTITHNEQDALDIIQDSYLKAWQCIGSLEKPEQFPAWLRQITGNMAKDYIKRHSPLLFLGSDDDTDDFFDLQEEKDCDYIPDAAMDTAETRRLIMDIVDDLPEDQRLCVLMYYYDDMSLQEIAAALEIPYGTVMSRLNLARKKISRSVEDLERKGTKLYGATPIPLFVWLLNNVAGEAGSKLPHAILGGTGIVAAVVVPKIIAGIAAVVIIGGGGVAGTVLVKRSQNTPMVAETTVIAATYATATQSEQNNDYAFLRGLTLPIPEVETRPYSYTQPYIPSSGYVHTVPSASRPVVANTSAATQTTHAGTTTTTAAKYAYTAAAVTATASPPTASQATTARQTTTASSTTTTSSTTSSATTTTTTTTTSTTTTTTTTEARPPQPSQPSPTTTTTAVAPVPQKITKSVGGVIFEYMSDVLPTDAVFQVNQGPGFTTEIVVRATNAGIVGFKLAYALNGVTGSGIPGGVTIKLPVPTEELPNIGELEVMHWGAPMSAAPEGSYLVFTT
jgi:RNA polymerase sigma factor (sigma-70 family)